MSFFIVNNFDFRFFQLTFIQNELTNSNVRKVELETELSSARSEIRDYKQRIQDLNTKIQELQRQVQDGHNNKNRAEDRIHELDKVTQRL